MLSQWGCQPLSQQPLDANGGDQWYSDAYSPWTWTDKHDYICGMKVSFHDNFFLVKYFHCCFFVLTCILLCLVFKWTNTNVYVYLLFVKILMCFIFIKSSFEDKKS